MKLGLDWIEQKIFDAYNDNEKEIILNREEIVTLLEFLNDYSNYKKKNINQILTYKNVLINQMLLTCVLKMLGMTDKEITDLVERITKHTDDIVLSKFDENMGAKNDGC